MIQTLQRLKAKKGFTIIELIVVMAILAVMMAIIFPFITSKKAKIDEANATARDFYAAMQSTMTKYSLYDGPLSPAYSANPELGGMRYYKNMGGNYPYVPVTPPPADDQPPVTTSLYIELYVKNGQFGDIVTYPVAATDTGYTNGVGVYNLAAKPTGSINNELGRLLKEELKSRISYRDGYYYAKVTYTHNATLTIPSKMMAETVKVDYTGYCRDGMPNPGGAGLAAYRNANMKFRDYNLLENGEIFGTCSAYNGSKTVGYIESYLT